MQTAISRIAPAPIFLLGILALLCPVAEAAESPGGVSVTFDAEGQMTLSLDGWKLYEGPAAVSAPQVRFRKPNQKPNLFGYSGPSTTGQTKPQTETFDARIRTALQTFDWGEIRRQYTSKPGRLDVTLTVTNTSDEVLWAFDTEVFPLDMPPGVLPARVSEATFFGQTIRPRAMNSLSGPLVLPLVIGERALVACSPEAKRPLEIRWNAPRKRAARPTGQHGDPVAQELADQQAEREKTGSDFPTDRWSLRLSAGGDRLIWHDRYTHRPIAPGRSDTYVVSLRWGRADDPVAPAADVCAAYAKAHPMQLDWPDRRPILRTFIGDWLPHTPPIDEKGSKPEPVTPDEKFRQRVMNAARGLVASMKEVDAQGMVIWNVEGSMVPRIKYVGSPEMIEYMCPEMDAVADDYFKTIREAGFTPGLCIRPTVLKPIRRESGELIWVHRFPEDESPVETLSREIAYAKKRWGCKLFYIDTNSNHRMPRTDEEKAWWPKHPDGRFKRYHVLMSAEQWQAILRNHPDILLIPEHSYLLCYTATAPYDQMNMGNIAGAGVTPEVVRATWPTAFKCLTTAYPPVRYWDRTVRAFAQDDVVMANAPVPDDGAPLNAARDVATFAGQGPPKELAEWSDSPLWERVKDPNAERRVRFFAARKLLRSGHVAPVGTVRELLAVEDWLIRKTALDAVAGEAHLPLTEDLLEMATGTPRSLQFAAIDALGEIGDAAIPALTRAAYGKNPQLHRPAVSALAASNDPQATATMMTILKDPNAPVAARAVAAQLLARKLRPKDARELVSVLLGLLDDPALRVNAAGALVNLRDKRIYPAAEKAMKDEESAEKPDRRFVNILQRVLRTQRRYR